LRILRQEPGFTLAAVAALALGIGANTAVFSLVNAVVLKPLPYPDAGRIVQLENTYSGVRTPIVGPAQFSLWRQNGTLQEVSAYWLDHMNLTTGASAELVPAAIVSGDFFRLFGARVALGRSFTSEEVRPGSGRFAVLSYETWTRTGSDSRIVGHTISLGGAPYLVVGVLAPFEAVFLNQAPAVWLPFQIDPNPSRKDSRLCSVAARIVPGASLSAVRAELQILAERHRTAAGGPLNSSDSFTAEPLAQALVGDIRPALWVFSGAVALVLLIACANVANLLSIRAVARRREFAVRTALGATRVQLLALVLSESAVLSLASGLLGLALGWTGIRALLALYPVAPLGPGAITATGIPRIGDGGSALSLDWRVLLFALGLSLGTAFVFAILPAFQVSRHDLFSSLKQGGSRSIGAERGRTLSLLVISELSFAVILLIGGGLLIRSFLALHAVDPGFDARHVLTMQMSLSDADSNGLPDMPHAVSRGTRQLRGLPGVQHAAAACCLPLETVWQLPYIVTGRPLRGRFHGFAGWTFVSPEYFDVLQIRLLRGRVFSESDAAGRPGVAVVNQTLARLIWPGRDPLGQQLLVGRTMGPEYESDPVRQIVGIVADVHDQTLARPPRPILYVPLAQVPESVQARVLPLLPIAWLIRTQPDAGLIGAAAAAQLREASGGLSVARIRSLEQVRSQSIALTRFQTTLMSVFAIAALSLAAIGIYGVMAYTVQRRIPELGIRLALGAQPAVLRRMVLYRGIRLALIGAALGIPSALWLTRLLSKLLFGVTAQDPLVFISVPIVLLALAAAAAWLPARRAAHIDPAQALRL
jgi:predicted permease